MITNGLMNKIVFVFAYYVILGYLIIKVQKINLVVSPQFIPGNMIQHIFYEKFNHFNLFEYNIDLL